MEQWPVWKIYMAGKASLEELEWYTLEELEKVGALIDMENDHQGARQMYLAEKSKKKGV